MDMRQIITIVEATIGRLDATYAGKPLRSFTSESELPFDPTKALQYLLQFSPFRNPNGKALAEDALHQAYQRIANKFAGSSRLKIYRMITAPEDFEPDFDGTFGIYWSWDRDGAYAYWGNESWAQSGIKWLITAMAFVNEIDWIETLAANANPNTTNEREITLKANVHVEIVSVEPSD